MPDKENISDRENSKKEESDKNGGKDGNKNCTCRKSELREDHLI